MCYRDDHVFTRLVDLPPAERVVTLVLNAHVVRQLAVVLVHVVAHGFRALLIVNTRLTQSQVANQIALERKRIIMSL